jgi:capsid portal protein
MVDGPGQSASRWFQHRGTGTTAPGALFQGEPSMNKVVPISRAFGDIIHQPAEGTQRIQTSPAPWQIQSSFAFNAGQFFSTHRRKNRLLEVPNPYSFHELLSIIERASSLRRSIDVMAKRVGGYGTEIVQRFPEATDASEEQRLTLEMILAGSGLECGGFREMRRRKDLDYYGIGNGLIRVKRGGLGQIVALEHQQASGFRLLEDGGEQVEVEAPLFLPSGKVVMTTRFSTFYRAIVYEGRSARYFKMLGDPRPLHSQTGETRKAGAGDFGDFEAEEILHFAEYWSGTKGIGVPTWISVKDEITAESNIGELLRRWTQDGCLDLTLLLSSNGTWDPEFRKDLTENLQDYARGVKNAFQVLLGSAVAGSDAAEGNQAAIIDDEHKPASNTIVPVDLSSKLDIEKIVTQLGQLSSYNRSYAFGLPPSLLGIVEEDSRATAEATKAAAEEGIFIPAREADDEFFNLYLLPAAGITDWKIRTKHARTGAAAAAVKDAQPLLAGGALSIDQTLAWLSQVSGFEFAPYDEPWSTVPIATAGRVAAGEMTPEQAGADEGAAVRSAEAFRTFAARVHSMTRAAIDPEVAGAIVADVKRQAERQGLTLPETTKR